MKPHVRPQKMLFIVLLAGTTLSGWAQSEKRSARLPLTITVFSESVSLPNFKNLFKNGSVGLRIGTEFTYTKNDSRQLLQTVQLSYYSRKQFQQAFIVTSEWGYRRFFGPVFADATVGLGYSLIHSALPRYENQDGQFVKAPPVFGRFAPTLGLGAGYQFHQFAAFTRYEMLGEVPFGFKGIPALPHRMLHIGTRLKIK